MMTIAAAVATAALATAAARTHEIEMKTDQRFVTRYISADAFYIIKWKIYSVNEDGDR